MSHMAWPQDQWPDFDASGVHADRERSAVRSIATHLRKDVRGNGHILLTHAPVALLSAATRCSYSQCITMASSPIAIHSGVEAPDAFAITPDSHRAGQSGGTRNHKRGFSQAKAYFQRVERMPDRELC
jgi:hypothetical protein